MLDEKSLRSWLTSNYPNLFLRRGQSERLGIWQQDKFWRSYEIPVRERPTDPEAAMIFDLTEDDEIRGFGFAYLQIGYSLVFEIRDRVFGGWICDEIVKRDPRLWANEGNLYHDAFILSKAKDADVTKRRAAKRESGEAMWKAVKGNEKLMNRIAYWMERGDMLRAGRELSLEELARNAYIENPKEVRSKHFKQQALGGLYDKVL